MQRRTAADTGLAELRPLAPDQETRLPLAIDLSSRRVREARGILAAVRAGQLLAAVLGQQFERDLADAGRQRYLAAFRKLTRFRPGTRLDELEVARHAAQDALTQRRSERAGKQDAVDRAATTVAAATQHLQELTARLADATAAAASYAPWRNRLGELDASIAALQATVDGTSGTRPVNQNVPRTINYPDP